MSTKEAPPRLSPEQLMVVTLDEIAGRLADQAAKGVLASKNFTIGTRWYPLIHGWISCTIYNDGPDDIYIRLRNDEGKDTPWAEGEAPLKSGENLILDLGARKQKTEDGAPTIWFICKAGTATIRIFQLG